MSTKIYTAYRLKEGVSLWDFVRKTHTQAVKNVKAELLKIYHKIIDTADTPEKRKEILTVAQRTAPSEIPNRLTPINASDFIRRKYGEQLSSPTRNVYALNVSIALREHEGRVYLIPYPGDTMRYTLDFLKEDPDLEDYAYWNNTDKPDEVSDEAWEERRRTWAALDKSWQTMLVLDVLTYESFIYIDPAWDEDVIKEWRAKYVTPEVPKTPAQ